MSAPPNTSLRPLTTVVHCCRRALQAPRSLNASVLLLVTALAAPGAASANESRASGAATTGVVDASAPARQEEAEASRSPAALSPAELAKVADYMARRALEGHIAFDAKEIEAATGVDIGAVDEQVVQQAVRKRLAELRREPPPQQPKAAATRGLVTLESFDQFVETFDAYRSVPRIVLLLSPT